jgi:hypothetical protein
MPISVRPPNLLTWAILTLWLVSSLGGLLYVEYHAALAGILCMALPH